MASFLKALKKKPTNSSCLLRQLAHFIWLKSFGFSLFLCHSAFVGIHSLSNIYCASFACACACAFIRRSLVATEKSYSLQGLLSKALNEAVLAVDAFCGSWCCCCCRGRLHQQQKTRIFQLNERIIIVIVIIISGTRKKAWVFRTPDEGFLRLQITKHHKQVLKVQKRCVLYLLVMWALKMQELSSCVN